MLWLSSLLALKNRHLLCSWLRSSVLSGTVKVGLLQIKWRNGLGVSTFSTSAHPQSDGMRRRDPEEDEVAKVEPLGRGWGPYTRLRRAFSPISTKLATLEGSYVQPKGSSAEPAPRAPWSPTSSLHQGRNKVSSVSTWSRAFFGTAMQTHQDTTLLRGT